MLPCRGLDGDTVLGERRAGGVHSGCDRGGPEALHDQPHAKRELPSSHREEAHREHSDLVVGAEKGL